MSDVIYEFIGMYEFFSKENQGFLKVLKCFVPFFHNPHYDVFRNQHNGLKLEKWHVNRCPLMCTRKRENHKSKYITIFYVSIIISKNLTKKDFT